jgi:hypothetical protein
MNDLEHDLRELFEQRASNVDVPGLAPKAVLHRGRRRQVGTVVTGVLACLVAAGVAAAAIGDARHRAVIPGRGNGLPERTTSIGGVPVTAPAGWTLVDDLPLAAILATTSESCSFSGSGTPVEGNGSSSEANGSSAGEAVPSATPVNGGASEGGTPESGQTCTTDNIGYPQGVPILQLANFEVPLTETVCGLADQQPAATMPPDGVAVYVGAFPGAVNSQPLLDACPGSESITGGDVLMTFADAGVQTAYAGVVVAGTSANPTDVAVAQTYLDSLDGLRIHPTSPPSGSGPGYVMAAGTSGDTSWRLEAGLTSLTRTPSVGASMFTTTASSTDVRTVDFTTDQRVNDDAIDLGGDAGVIQFGTASTDVTGIHIALPSGGTIPATLVSWPTEIASDLDVPSQEGWIWYAEAPERGTAQARSAGPSSEASPPRRPEPGALQTFTDGDGVYTIAGNDFGHDWFFQQHNGGEFRFFLDGKEQSSVLLRSGGETQIDIPGGTLGFAVEPPTVKHLYVTSDAAGTDVVVSGAWVRSANDPELAAHIWVVALPGSGTGYEWQDGPLPIAIAWPTDPTQSPGDLISAGATPAVSWKEVWSDRGCPTLEVVASVSGDGDLGTADCPVPWDPQGYPNRISYIGGVYGQVHATVWMLGPAGMAADATSKDDPTVGGFCGGSISNEGAWAQTSECIFVIPVGQTYVIHPTLQDGTPLEKTITITARPGGVDTSEAGAADSPAP